MRVLDTNVLIYYSLNELTVIEKIEHWRAREPLLISTIVEAELLSWANLSPSKIANIQQGLLSFTIIPVNSTIAHTAAAIRRAYRTELLDALIAATALHYKATLVTRNVKDFAKIKEITVEKI